nr:MAG TPA: hypothetical protein [Caudoviricetes sp.]
MLNIDVNDTLQISNPKINTNFENLDNTKQSKITSTGILKGNGSGSIISATAGTDYATPAQVATKQNTIYATGILKGTGSGTVSAATAGTDYVAPSYFTASQADVTLNTSYFSPLGWWGYVRKRGFLCTVKLAFKCTSTISTGTTICTLPNGYYCYDGKIQNVIDSTSVKVSVEDSTVTVNGSMPAGSYQVCITYICSD